MTQEKLKQLELLVNQTAARLQTLQGENAALRQKVRAQEQALLDAKETETELKALREWKKNTVQVLHRLETRLDKEIAKAKEQQKQNGWE